MRQEGELFQEFRGECGLRNSPGRLPTTIWRRKTGVEGKEVALQARRRRRLVPAALERRPNVVAERPTRSRRVGCPLDRLASEASEGELDRSMKWVLTYELRSHEPGDRRAASFECTLFNKHINL